MRAVRPLSARSLGSKGYRPRQSKTAEDNFDFQLRAHQINGYRRQARMAKSEFPNEKRRFWSFDFVWLVPRLIVEIDGGIWMQGGGAHSHPTDIVRNMAKRNDAALAGWYVVSFTPDEVRSGHAVEFTQRMLAALRARLVNAYLGMDAFQPGEDDLPF